MFVHDDFYDAVLRQIAAPITEQNLRACHAWQAAEGGSANWNPFNTTQPEPGDNDYNSFGPHGEDHVRNYPSEQTGIRATVSTLLNGHYESIVSAFRHGGDGAAVCSAVDGSVWGTHGAHAQFQRMYGNSNPPRRELREGMHGSDVLQVKHALIAHGFNHAKMSLDQNFGQHMLQNVRDFQHARHLLPDGIVGPKTYAALGM